MINDYILGEMKGYPIPTVYKDRAMYCRVLIYGAVVFYYDKDYKFLCKVERKD
jgi:hypothetical protein